MKERKVLIIDDEPSFTSMVKLNLERTKRYTVTEANAPSAGVEMARQLVPDLILLDVVMPGQDGGQVLSQIQKTEALKNVPVIFLTATMTSQGLHDRHDKIGGYPFVAKPVDPKTLMRRIDEELSKQSQNT